MHHDLVSNCRVPAVSNSTEGGGAEYRENEEDDDDQDDENEINDNDY